MQELRHKQNVELLFNQASLEDTGFNLQYSFYMLEHLNIFVTNVSFAWVYISSFS